MPRSTPLLQDWLGDDAAKGHRREIHFPSGRFGEAIEQAQAVLWLASDESSFVNGHDQVVDGGMTKVWKLQPPYSEHDSIDTHYLDRHTSRLRVLPRNHHPVLLAETGLASHVGRSQASEGTPARKNRVYSLLLHKHIDDMSLRNSSSAR